jgi:hypothetical protein
MLPFSRLVEYGNIVPVAEYDVAFNFDNFISYGKHSVQINQYIGTGVTTPIPVTYPGYTNMYRLTNSTINMSPDGVLNIGTSNFEYTLTFYLYPGGSGYDYVMNFSQNQTENSIMMIRIADGGLGNRLQFSIGAYDTSNRISCNKTRAQLEGKVNVLKIQRVNGVITSYLNGEQMLMGAWTNPSVNSTFANSSSVTVNKYFFGEYDGTTKFSEDIGYIDFKFKFLGS